VWGESFTEAVPATILFVSNKVGGICAGAFDSGQLVGFVFGISGIEDGTAVHWSDMLAVRASYRNRGIGERLKLYQKEVLRSRGVVRIYWSFDPLESKNAHINFNHLGITARSYVVDMYGETSSPLHAFGTDRLIATWDLMHDRKSTPTDKRISIPVDIHALHRADPAMAKKWREEVRAQFLELLPNYVVVGFERGENESAYLLTSASNLAV
jgi:predicted GNAT superfamily acetyltransferase